MIDSDNRYIQVLKQAGTKITIQRMAVCRYLADATIHPTVADVYDELVVDYPTMSLATVYNAMKLLTDLNLICEIQATSDGSSRYEVDLTPHINFHCHHCDTIYDAPLTDVGSIAASAADIGFSISNRPILVHGLCHHCNQ